MIYIVDIDNTICDTPNIDGVNRYDMATPIRSRIAKINGLYEAGQTIIYWTARGGSTGIDWTDLTTTQLHQWGCKYHELRMRKPSYDVWIDDKAFNATELDRV